MLEHKTNPRNFSARLSSSVTGHFHKHPCRAGRADPCHHSSVGNEQARGREGHRAAIVKPRVKPRAWRARIQNNEETTANSARNQWMPLCLRRSTPPFASARCPSQQDPRSSRGKETLTGFLKTFTLFIFAVALCFPRCVCSNAKSHMTCAALIVSPPALDFLVSLAGNQTGLALQGGAALPRLTASSFS